MNPDFSKVCNNSKVKYVWLTLSKEQFQCSHSQCREHPVNLLYLQMMKAVYLEHVLDTTLHLPDTALYTDHLKHEPNITRQ